MAEIEKEEVEFPACATLWQGNLHKVAAPYFLLFMYMVQLYKEDWTTLRTLGCRAVSLPSTEQIVKYFEAKITTQASICVPSLAQGIVCG